MNEKQITITGTEQTTKEEKLFYAYFIIKIVCCVILVILLFALVSEIHTLNEQFEHLMYHNYGCCGSFH